MMTYSNNCAGLLRESILQLLLLLLYEGAPSSQQLMHLGYKMFLKVSKYPDKIDLSSINNDMKHVYVFSFQNILSCLLKLHVSDSDGTIVSYFLQSKVTDNRSTCIL